MITRIGAWVDRRGVGADWLEWLDVAKHVGLTDVSLCVHGQDAGQPFEPFASAAKVAQVVEAYAARGIRPHAMFWPQPRAAHASALLDYLTELRAKAPSLASAELDVEEQWTRSAWRLALGGRVARQLRDGWPKGLPLVVNGITAALPKLLPLAELADELIPQAYTSTRKGQGSTPGARQDEVADTWRRVLKNGATLSMGLAAYGQDGAGGLKAADAMARAFDACQDETSRVMYWSLADLAGGPAGAFVRARCAELTRPPA